MNRTHREVAQALRKVAADYDYTDDFNHAPEAVAEVAKAIADIFDANHTGTFDLEQFLTEAGVQ